MSTSSRKARNADVGFSVGVLIVGVVFLVQAWKLPPSRFDPLGPGSFPIAICLLLIVLSGLALVQSLRGKSLGAAETSMILGVGEEGLGRRRPLLALLVLLLAAAYAAALHWVPLGFFWATTAFVFAAGFGMSRRSLKAAAIALAVALGVSGALTFVFGGLLGFPLP
jgi:hypothetical protein